MTKENLEFIIPLLVALAALLPQVLQWISSRRKLQADTNKTEAESKSELSEAAEGAGRTLALAWKRIDELTEKVRVLEDELRKWRNYAARLIRRLVEVDPKGEIPPFEEKDTKDRMKVEAK